MSVKGGWLDTVSLNETSFRLALARICFALLDEEAPRRRIGDIAQDHALQLRRAGRRVRIGIEDKRLMGGVGADLERAAAGGIGLQPAIAEIVAADMPAHLLLVDDRGD